MTELALKAAARQLSVTEQAEVEALLADEGGLRREFEQRLAEARSLADVAALLNATESRSGELPGYARERLRTKVRQTYLNVPSDTKSPAGHRGIWKLWLGWSAGLAIIAILLTFLAGNPGPMTVQVAMLDPVGAVRGGEIPELRQLNSKWPESPAKAFKTDAEIQEWQKTLAQASGDNTVLIIYDRSAGEVRVSGKRRGRPFERRFELSGELAPILEQVQKFMDAQ